MYAIRSYYVSRLAIGMPSWIDRRDLISAGVVGLIDAAKHFVTRDDEIAVDVITSYSIHYTKLYD